MNLFFVKSNEGNNVCSNTYLHSLTHLRCTREYRFASHPLISNQTESIYLEMLIQPDLIFYK